MKPVLKDLYDCSEVFDRMIPMDTDPDLDQLELEIREDEAYFNDKLSAEDCERFKKMRGNKHAAYEKYDFLSFALGFRLGARLMIETLSDEP